MASAFAALADLLGGTLYARIVRGDYQGAHEATFRDPSCVNQASLDALLQRNLSEPNAQSVFSRMIDVAPQLITEELFVSSLNNRPAFQVLLSKKPELLTREVVNRCFAHIIKEHLDGACEDLIHTLREKKIIDLTNYFLQGEENRFPLIIQVAQATKQRFFEYDGVKIPSGSLYDEGRDWNEKVFALFLRESDLSQFSGDTGESFLHTLVKTGNHRCVQALFEQKFEEMFSLIEEKNWEDETPLEIALRKSPFMIDTLVSLGAEFPLGDAPVHLSDEEKRGWYHLDRTARRGQFSVDPRVRERIPEKIRERKELGMKRFVATMVGHEVDFEEFDKLLQEEYVDPNFVVDDKGHTLAHIVVLWNREAANLKRLDERGADFMRTNSSGQNSLHIAVQENAYHALAFLKEKFPKEVWIQHPDQDGLTPFDYFFSITSADEGEDIGE